MHIEIQFLLYFYLILISFVTKIKSRLFLLAVYCGRNSTNWTSLKSQCPCECFIYDYYILFYYSKTILYENVLKLRAKIVYTAERRV